MLKSNVVNPIAILFFICINLGVVFAASPDDATLFVQGQSAFNSGQYEKALSLFKQAEESGLQKPSLYYNIGVCAYRLKQYSQAEAAFNKVIARSTGLAPLAHYNLGLVAMRQGKRKEMIHGFETAMVTTNDSKIRDMAAAALEQNNVIPLSAQKPYSGYGEVSFGYDDNIELYNDVLGSQGDGDWFTELYAAGTMPIQNGTLRQGPQIFGSLYYKNYADDNQYDLVTAGIGGRYLFEHNDWQIKPSVDYAYTIQDTKSYEQRPTFKIQGRHSFYGGTQLSLDYHLSYIDILDSDYDSVEGWRNRLRTEISKGWGKTRLSFRYTLELNDRDDDNLSPTRQTFTTKLRHRVTDKVTTMGIISYRNSHYDTAPGVDREEDQWKTTLRLMYNIDRNWTTTADYTYTDNDDNPEYEYYSYTRNVSALRLERSF